MAKRSPTSRGVSTRMNVNVDNGHVKPEPGEARIQEPTVTEWDPHDGDPGVKPEDARVPDINDETVGRPVATPPADEADKQARIRKLLSNEERAAEEETEDQKPAPEAAKPAVSEPVKPATRRDILANLGAERQKRTLEQQLKTERSTRERTERERDDALKLAREGDLLSIAKARGLTSDQAIDLLINPQAEQPKPAAAAPADQTNERLTRLELRERDLNRREALAVLDDETKELDIPVTRATNRVAVADDKGRTTIMSGRDLIMATAQRLWEADGKPAGDRRHYLKEAAPLVEETLINDDKDRFEAYAKRGGGTPAKPEPKPVVTKKAAVPSVGSRSGGATTKTETPELPDDPDERRQIIKRRLGW